MIHHQKAGGYPAEIADRGSAINRPLEMIQELEIDPRDLVKAIERRTGSALGVALSGSPASSRVALQPGREVPSPPPSSEIFVPMSLGATAAPDGLDLISRWARERGTLKLK